MQCTMCGYEFEPSGLVCHSGCPLGAHCSVICCPRCGYSTVDPARTGVVRWLRRLVGGNTVAQLAHRPGLTVMDLEPGQEAVVTEVAGDPARAQQLSHYGLTPGISVTLTQKRPLPVIQVGRTDLALDAAVACQIYVSPDALDA